MSSSSRPVSPAGRASSAKSAAPPVARKPKTPKQYPGTAAVNLQESGAYGDGAPRAGGRRRRRRKSKRKSRKKSHKKKRKTKRRRKSRKKRTKRRRR